MSLSIVQRVARTTRKALALSFAAATVLAMAASAVRADEPTTDPEEGFAIWGTQAEPAPAEEGFAIWGESVDLIADEDGFAIWGEFVAPDPEGFAIWGESAVWTLPIADPIFGLPVFRAGRIVGE